MDLLLPLLGCLACLALSCLIARAESKSGRTRR
jgi:hypothetical protein